MAQQSIEDRVGNARARILILSTEFPPGPGGIATHAFQLARHLDRLGWLVHVLSPQSYITDAEREAFNRQQPFAIITLPERGSGSWWWFDRFKFIAVSIRTAKPDLLVATGQRALLTAALLHFLTRIPWVMVGHGSEFRRLSRIQSWLMKQVISRVNAVIAVSHFTARLIQDVATPRELVVIPNAADGERFRPGLDTGALRQRWGLSHCRVLLTVGQLSERKAQDVVIRAMPRILSVFPDAVYVMAGLPSRKPELAALAAELGVIDQVRFIGLVPEEDLPSLYNLGDLFVLVSRQSPAGEVEGYGIVVQEAALCGLPAVVSQDCGLAEAIQEGHTGVSVRSDDPAATAAAIIDLFADPARRQQMGRHARELALSATWSERAGEYDRLFRSLLTSRTQLSPEGLRN